MIRASTESDLPPISRVTLITDNPRPYRNRTNTVDSTGTSKTSSSKITQTFKSHVRNAALGKTLGKIAVKHDLVPTYTPNEEALYAIPEDVLHSRDSYTDIINAAIAHARANVAKGERPIYAQPNPPRSANAPIEIKPRYQSVDIEKGAWDLLDDEFEQHPERSGRSLQELPKIRTNVGQPQQYPTVLEPITNPSQSDSINPVQIKGATYHDFEHGKLDIEAVSRPKHYSMLPLTDAEGGRTNVTPLFSDSNSQGPLPQSLVAERQKPDLESEQPESTSPDSPGPLKQKLLTAQMMTVQLEESNEVSSQGPTRSKSANKRRTTTIVFGRSIDTEKANIRAAADAMRPSIAVIGTTSPIQDTAQSDKAESIKPKEAVFAVPASVFSDSKTDPSMKKQADPYDLSKHIKSDDSNITAQEAYERGLFASGTLTRLDKTEWEKLASRYGIQKTPAAENGRQTRLDEKIARRIELAAQLAETRIEEPRPAEVAEETKINEIATSKPQLIQQPLRHEHRDVADTRLTASARTFHPDLPAHHLKTKPPVGPIPVVPISRLTPYHEPLQSFQNRDRKPVRDIIPVADCTDESQLPKNRWGQPLPQAKRQWLEIQAKKSGLAASAKTFHPEMPVHALKPEPKPAGQRSRSPPPSDLAANAKTFYYDAIEHAIRQQQAAKMIDISKPKPAQPAKGLAANAKTFDPNASDHIVKQERADELIQENQPKLSKEGQPKLTKEGQAIWDNILRNRERRDARLAAEAAARQSNPPITAAQVDRLIGQPVPEQYRPYTTTRQLRRPVQRSAAAPQLPCLNLNTDFSRQIYEQNAYIAGYQAGLVLPSHTHTQSQAQAQAQAQVQVQVQPRGPTPSPPAPTVQLLTSSLHPPSQKIQPPPLSIPTSTSASINPPTCTSESTATALQRTLTQHARALNASRRTVRNPNNDGYRFVDRDASSESNERQWSAEYRERRRDERRRQEIALQIALEREQERERREQQERMDRVAGLDMQTGSIWEPS